MTSARATLGQLDTSSDELAISQVLRANHSTLTSLEYCKEQTEQLLDLLPDVLVVIQPDGTILKGNASTATLLSTDIELLHENSMVPLFRPSNWATLKAKLETLSTSGTEGSIDLELPIDCGNGDRRHYHWIIRLYDRGAKPRENLFVVQGRDISRLRKYESQMLELFSCIPLGILTIASDGTVENKHSRHLESIFGKVNIQGQKFSKLILDRLNGENVSPATQEGFRVLEQWAGQTESWWNMHCDRIPTEICIPPVDDGPPKDVELIYHPVVLDDKVTQLLIIIQNRTEWVRDRLSRASAVEPRLVDSLTGLPNKHALTDFLKERWSEFRRQQTPFAVILLDVDHFKLFNDAYGQREGDQSLVQIASVLSRLVQGDANAIARYSGEEFAVILADTTAEDALSIALQIQNRITELNIPHQSSPIHPYLTVSMGVAIVNEQMSSRGSVNGILERADRALLAAKQSGRDSIRIFSSEDK